MKKINIQISFPPKVTPVSLSLAMAVLFAFVYNFALIKKTLGFALAFVESDYDFNLSIFVLPVCVFNLIFLFLCIRRVEKYIFSFLILLSSVLSYAQLSYGIVFDSDMIRNIVETDQHEALSYFSWTLLVWIALTGALPLWVLWRTKIVYASTIKRGFLYRLRSFTISFAVIGLIAVFSYDDYATTIRNNTELRNMPVPIYALKGAYKYVRQEYFKPADKPLVKLGMDAIQKNQKKAKNNLIVLIVGETQRAMNYQLNGYAKNTNEYTIKQGVISFGAMESCGTATAKSVPCMFSNLGREEFSVSKAEAQENVLDVLQRAGVNILWLDNDSGCKGVCNRVPNVNLYKKHKDNKKYCPGSYCYDEIFLPELEKTLPTLPKDRDTLLVLHVMGSHGPSYFERYPLNFQEYMPDCDRNDVQFCTYEQLVNEYDNTIRHFDYVMSKIIESVGEVDELNTSLLFISDHGESLGEKNVYLHGLPYMFAPAEQTHVPFLAWLPESYKAANRLDSSCIAGLTKKGGYTHDNLFDTILGLFDVETSIYRPEMDIFKSCRN